MDQTLQTCDVFISYRRDGGDMAAMYFYQALKERGYNVFYDLEVLRAGKFNEALFSSIQSCKDFVLILSPHALDRCNDPNDWVRKEIAEALRTKKNIVPVMLKGFEFPKQLPVDIEDVRYQNGLTCTTEYFVESINRLCGKYLNSKPVGRKKTVNMWVPIAAVSMIAVAVLLVVSFLLPHRTDKTEHTAAEVTVEPVPVDTAETIAVTTVEPAKEPVVAADEQVAVDTPETIPVSLAEKVRSPKLKILIDDVTVVLDGKQTEESMPEGITFEDGMLYVNNAHRACYVEVFGDLMVRVFGDCRLDYGITSHEGDLIFSGEEGATICSQGIRTETGSLCFDGVNYIFLDGMMTISDGWDALWSQKDFSAKNCSITMPDEVGIYTAEGALNLTNVTASTSRVSSVQDMIISDSRINFVKQHQWTNEGINWAVFCEANTFIRNSSIQHASIYSKNGLELSNNAMVLEQLVYCPEGNITIAGSKITSTAPIRGEQTLIRIEDSTLEIDNQLDEYSAMDTNMTEESGLEVHRSDIKLKSVGSNTFGGRFVIYDSNVEAEIEKAPERFPDRDKRNTNAFDLKDYPNVLVTNSSMKLNGIQSGILMERGNLNIVGSDIEAEGNIGFYVYKGDISVVGGKLKLYGKTDGVYIDNGRLNLFAVDADITSDACAIMVEHTSDDQLITISACDGEYSFVTEPDGIKTVSYSAEDGAHRVWDNNEFSLPSAENAITRIILKPNDRSQMVRLKRSLQ